MKRRASDSIQDVQVGPLGGERVNHLVVVALDRESDGVVALLVDDHQLGEVIHQDCDKMSKAILDGNHESGLPLVILLVRIRLAFEEQSEHRRPVAGNRSHQHGFRHPGRLGRASPVLDAEQLIEIILHLDHVLVRENKLI